MIIYYEVSITNKNLLIRARRRHDSVNGERELLPCVRKSQPDRRLLLLYVPVVFFCDNKGDPLIIQAGPKCDSVNGLRFVRKMFDFLTVG